MSATFNPQLPRAVDRLRFALGDTNDQAALLDDQTIQALLGVYMDDEERALLELAHGLIARWAQEPTRLSLTGDGGSAEWANRLAGWQQIVTRLGPRYDKNSSGNQGSGVAGISTTRCIATRSW